METPTSSTNLNEILSFITAERIATQDLLNEQNAHDCNNRLAHRIQGRLGALHDLETEIRLRMSAHEHC